MVSFAFAIYLVPGLFGANLSSLSGLLPPKTAQKFDLTISQSANNNENSLCDTPKYDDMLSIPYQINAYFDYKQAFDCAKAQNKPIVLYFTGHSCSNCKKMQGEIWSDSKVQEYFNEEFIVAALFVDDRVIEMNESDWFTSEIDGKLKKKMGEANADIQILNFNSNTQPYYVTISPDGKVLNTPMTYNNNVTEFVEFLEKSLEQFEN
jgi:thioredoxin-related protein